MTRLLLLLLSIAPLILGCGEPVQVPTRSELVELLGELPPDVVVLSGQVQRNSEEMIINRTWVVRSHTALSVPLSQDRWNVNFDKSGEIRVTEDAYPAQVLYDIAAASKIDQRELPSPGNKNLALAKGRLAEWKRKGWAVRLRDFQTDQDFLSIVEAIRAD